MLRHLPMGAAALAGVVALVAGMSAARAEPPVTTFTLDNGMKVVVIEDHRAPVVTHMVWYPVGAADEPRGSSGVAHFFEHLMFKATDDLEAGEFSRIVAENGGSGNAFTSPDYTGYFQRIAGDRLGLMMSLEADRMKDLVLNDEVVETEREVILEERSSRTDNSPQGLFNERMRAMQFVNHPYGTPVIGWRHEIEALDAEDAIAFYRRFYAPDNAILVVAGDVTPDEVRRLAEENYGPLEPSGKPPGPRAKEPPQFEERRLIMRDPQVRQPYFARYYTVPSQTSGDLAEGAALELLSMVLGSGITSMLSEAVQIEQGKAIGIGAWYSRESRDLTTFGVWAAPSDETAIEALEAAIDDVIARVKEGVDPEHLERARRTVLANEIYAQDDQAGLARGYGAALASGYTVEDVQAWPDAVAAVTAEDVRRAAETWLKPGHSVTGYLLGSDGDPVDGAAGGTEGGAADGAAAPDEPGEPVDTSGEKEAG